MNTELDVNNDKIGSKLRVSWIHCDVSASVKERIKRKAEKLYRHCDKIQRIEFEIEKEYNPARKGEYLVRCHASVAGAWMNAHSSKANLYRAIDEVVNLVDRQLRFRANRVLSRRRQGLSEFAFGSVGCPALVGSILPCTQALPLQ